MENNYFGAGLIQGKLYSIAFILILTTLLSIRSMAQAPPGAKEKATEFFISKQESWPAGQPVTFNKAFEYKGLWVFEKENPESFIIVKKEDSEYLIGGYSFRNKFSDHDELPEPGKLCLDAVSRASVKALKKKNQNTSYPDFISPLTETKWGQDCFFNYYCPTDYRAYCDHVPVGCVPVAMGQIMRYYGKYNNFFLEEKFESDKYPEETVIMGNYDWEKMENEPVCIDLEVSRFLYHLGVITKVIYNHELTSTSTYNAWVAFGKMTYLASLRMVRSTTIKETWIDAFYRNISQFMPIYVAGGGHAFVCDGYDSEGMFHFNLGWGGSADGYYPLIGTGAPIISEALVDLKPHSLVLPPVNLSLKKGETKDSLVWEPHPYAETLPFKYRIYQDEKQFDETDKLSYPANVFEHGTHSIKVSAWYVNGESRWTGPIKVFRKGEDVDIPDLNLKKSMNRALGYQGDEIISHDPGAEELIAIKVLSSEDPVVDFSGIEYCRGLLTLRLLDNHGAQIDLKKLIHNKKLKSLEINNAEIIDFQNIAEFKDLVFLKTDGSNIPSLNFISENRELIWFDYKNSGAPPLDSIVNLTGLMHLDLSNTGIEEADFVNNFPEIKELNLSDNSLDEFELSKKFIWLRTLDLANNEIDEMSFIEQIPNLKNLKLENNRVNNFELFKPFPDLKSIDVSENNIMLVKINKPQNSLHDINLANNKIQNIDRLVEFALNIEEINLGNNQISQLWEQSIQKLKKLDLSNNLVKTIDDIQLNPSLEYLNLSENMIGDFHPLYKHNFFKRLEFLDISDNPASRESFNEYFPGFNDSISSTIMDDAYNPYCASYPIPQRNSNLGSSSVQLDWDGADSGDVLGYNLYFGEPGQMEMVERMLKTRQYTVDIQPDSRYQWQVVTVLEDTSFTSGIFNFNTFKPIELPFYDGFEEYEINNKVSAESPYWVTKTKYDNNSEDALVVGFRRFSGQKSLKLLGNSHLFLAIDNFLGEVLYIEFNMLIEEGKIACLRMFEITGFKFEVYFKSNKTADILINDKVITSFTYRTDEWNPVRLTLNARHEYFSFAMSGKTHLRQSWIYPNGLVELQNIELSGEKSPNYPSDGYPLFYLDDFYVIESHSVSTDPILGYEEEAVIYPNPVQGAFYIKNNLMNPVKTIEICNTKGQVIKRISEITEQEPSIKTNNIPPGIYWVRTRFSDNSSSVQKIIITNQ